MDFTSSLYLGLQHRSESLRSWAQFSTGVPAALAPPIGSEAVSQAIADLQGCERGVVGPSTLHLFCDLFVMFPSSSFSIYFDTEVYPIAKWCIERAIARGVEVHSISHFDVCAMKAQIKSTMKMDTRPIIVTDGYCRGCGQVAPILEYLEILNHYGGYLIIDDTQALGILGCKPNTENPYGSGGGGSLRYCSVHGPNLIVVSSLAKGFGTPLAVLIGSKKIIRTFENRSATRVHCSPPSIPALCAALHAIERNNCVGDVIRRHLLHLVKYFKQRISYIGLQARESLFPMQTIILPQRVDVLALHSYLLRQGIKTILHQLHGVGTFSISLIITARHRKEDIDHAVESIQQALAVLYKKKSTWT